MYSFLEHIFDKKLVDKIGPYTIYQVNETKIRNISVEKDEFNDFATHMQFKMVPNNEIWLGKDTDREEWPFLINNAIHQYEAKKAGHKDWYEYALRLEKIERRKVDGRFPKKSPPDSLYDRIYCRIRVVTVWFVDGRVVRDTYKTDFVEGGNSTVYRFIPKNEIWVEKNLSGAELIPTILHEYVESQLMARYSYNKAHYLASKVDWHHRHHFSKENLENLTPEKAWKLAEPYLDKG